MEIDPPATAPEAVLPPPKLYPARETYFEQFIEPKSDGYQQAKSRGGDSAAIVIDNGGNLCSFVRAHC
jgi:actin-related protein 5